MLPVPSSESGEESLSASSMLPSPQRHTRRPPSPQGKPGSQSPPSRSWADNRQVEGSEPGARTPSGPDPAAMSHEYGGGGKENGHPVLVVLDTAAQLSVLSAKWVQKDLVGELGNECISRG